MPNITPKDKPAPQPKKPANTKAPRDVKVLVDGKLKKQWDQTLTAIKKAKGQGAEAFDELWEAVARVVEHDPPLYVIGGFGSSAEFFAQVLQEKERTARRFIRVAKYATPQEEEKYGTTLLDAALSYVEATAGGPLAGPLPIAFERLRIPVTRDGKEARVPLSEATAEEIAKATRALLATKGKKRAASNPIEETLGKALASNAATKVVRATVRGGAATFSGVPVASIPAFGKTLASVKLPPAETKANVANSTKPGPSAKGKSGK